MLTDPVSRIPEISGIRFWAVTAILLVAVGLIVHAFRSHTRLLALLQRLPPDEAARYLEHGNAIRQTANDVEAVVRGNLAGSGFLLLVFGGFAMTQHWPFVALGAVGVTMWVFGALTMRVVINVSAGAGRVRCKVGRRWGPFETSHEVAGQAPATFYTQPRSDSEGPMGLDLCIRCSDGSTFEVLPASTFVFMWKPMLTQAYVAVLASVLNHLRDRNGGQ